MSSHVPRWVPSLVIEAVQLDQLREHGGLLGVRDEAALESALARPKQRWTDEPSADLPDLAATYAFEISARRPFRGGNNRIALLAAVVFLGLNGLHLAAPAAEAASQMRALVSQKSGSQRALATWIRSRAVSDPRHQ